MTEQEIWQPEIEEDDNLLEEIAEEVKFLMENENMTEEEAYENLEYYKSVAEGYIDFLLMQREQKNVENIYAEETGLLSKEEEQELKGLIFVEKPTRDMEFSKMEELAKKIHRKMQLIAKKFRITEEQAYKMFY